MWPLPSAFSVPSQMSPWGGRSSDPCFPGRPGGSVLGSAFPAQRRPREERVLSGEPIHPRPPLHGRDWGVRHGDQVDRGDLEERPGCRAASGHVLCPLVQRLSLARLPGLCPDSSQALLIPGELLPDGHVGCVCVRVCVCARTISCLYSPAFLVFSKRSLCLTLLCLPFGTKQGFTECPVNVRFFCIM